MIHPGITDAGRNKINQKVNSRNLLLQLLAFSLKRIDPEFYDVDLFHGRKT